MDKKSKIDNINPELVDKYRKKFQNLDPKKRKELEASIGWLFITDSIKKKKRELIQKKMRTNDLITLVVAIIGIFLNIIASSIYITFQIEEGKFYININYRH